jgi:POT family proton-dependent oligopeptide transporter
MRALLILFMKDVLLARGRWTEVVGMKTLAGIYGAPDDAADDETREKQVLALASRVYGLYTAFVYLTPIFGGYLADRYFGTHVMIIAGAVLMVRRYQYQPNLKVVCCHNPTRFRFL